MTYLEAPTKTIENFIPSWRFTEPDRLGQEIVSAFNETHRNADDYKFKFKEGKLVDLKTETEIKIDTSTYLGKKDAEFLDCLTSWVGENESGVALWISPSYEAAYPCNKITMYKIETEHYEKTTFNVTVLFDTSKQHTLEIASKLNPNLEKVSDPEVLRNKLFVTDDNFTLTDLFLLIGKEETQTSKPDKDLIEYFVDLIHSGKDSRLIAMEMQQKGIIGNFSVSCAGNQTLSGLEQNSLTLNFAGNKDRYGSLNFTCPHCGAVNIRPHGQLINSCQHCGGNVRC